MKNLNWILHALSLAAIIFLFYQNSQLKKSTPTSSAATEIKSQNTGDASTPLAYFISDSLLNNLGFFKESEKAFKAKQESMSNEIKAKENAMQKELVRLQENAQNMTRVEMESAQQKLAKMEQDLMARKEKLGSQYAQETAEFNEKLHNKITSYLKELNQNGKYKFVFSVSPESNIFFSDESLNITDQMIKDLNEKYSTN